jgi:hypothetical protein
MSFLTASTLAQPDQLHGATVRAQS